MTDIFSFLLRRPEIASASCCNRCNCYTRVARRLFAADAAGAATGNG